MHPASDEDSDGDSLPEPIGLADDDDDDGVLFDIRG